MLGHDEMEALMTRTVQWRWVFERGCETVLLDAGSLVTVRWGGIVDLGEMFENDGGRRDVVLGVDSFGRVAPGDADGREL